MEEFCDECNAISLGLLYLVYYWRMSRSSPPGFVKTTIPLNAPPVGLAFDAGGSLFALEGAPFGDNAGDAARVSAQWLASDELSGRRATIQAISSSAA